MSDDFTLPARVRAPEIPPTLDWIDAGGRPLGVAAFRGRLLFLDFWTYG